MGAIGDVSGALQSDQEFRRDSKRLFKALQCIAIPVQPLECQTASGKEPRIGGLLFQSQLDLLEKSLRFDITLLIQYSELRKQRYQECGNEKQGSALQPIVLREGKCGGGREQVRPHPHTSEDYASAHLDNPRVVRIGRLPEIRVVQVSVDAL